VCAQTAWGELWPITSRDTPCAQEAMTDAMTKIRLKGSKISRGLLSRAAQY